VELVKPARLQSRPTTFIQAEIFALM